MDIISNILKGFGMGAANVVPGVSGGTIALITGIYSRIINSISALASVSTWKLLLCKKTGSSISKNSKVDSTKADSCISNSTAANSYTNNGFKAWWKAIDGNFLVQIFAGILLSIISLAKLVTWALACYPVLTWAFFFGLIVVSALYMILDIRRENRIVTKDYIWALVGVALGLAFCFLSPTSTPSTPFFFFLSGAIAICTMILPGVSGSFVLQILGNYSTVMQAITELDFGVLVPFVVGAVVGIVAFAKLLKWLLAHHQKATMLILVGFVMGTLLKVWPWANMESVVEAGKGLQIPGAIVAMIIGGALVVVIQKLSKTANGSKAV